MPSQQMAVHSRVYNNNNNNNNNNNSSSNNNSNALNICILAGGGSPRVVGGCEVHHRCAQGFDGSLLLRPQLRVSFLPRLQYQHRHNRSAACKATPPHACDKHEKHRCRVRVGHSQTHSPRVYREVMRLVIIYNTYIEVAL